ncbi:MAG: hypothetical protein H0W76_20935 [Pyrinomonadaceae bacterium]|nr:hypothetical protein [Pyrinomonadaceae bacterium]
MAKSKSLNSEEQAADSIKPATDARHGLQLIPGKEPGIKIGAPADESLCELIESFKRPHKNQRPSPDDDDLPPAA